MKDSQVLAVKKDENIHENFKNESLSFLYNCRQIDYTSR